MDVVMCVCLTLLLAVGSHGADDSPPVLEVAPEPIMCAMCSVTVVMDTDGNEYIRDGCQALPRECELERPKCRCCEECRKELGESCDVTTASCLDGLTCRNEKGETLDPTSNYVFDGTCVADYSTVSRKRAAQLFARFRKSFGQGRA